MRQQKSISKKPTLDKLMFGASTASSSYNGRSIRRYQAIWNRLISFAKQNYFENKLSDQVGTSAAK